MNFLDKRSCRELGDLESQHLMITLTRKRVYRAVSSHFVQSGAVSILLHLSQRQLKLAFTGYQVLGRVRYRFRKK